MLTVTEFRAKYPDSTDEQVALYAAAVAAELANPPKPEPDLPMPRITVQRTPSEIGRGTPASRTAPYGMTPRFGGVIHDGVILDIPPAEKSADLTSAIRRTVLGRRLTSAERAQAERTDMNGDDLLALLAGAPNAREFEALEGGD